MIYAAILMQVFALVGAVFSALAYTPDERQIGLFAALLFSGVALWFAYRAGAA